MTDVLPFIDSPYSISGTLRNLGKIPSHLRKRAIWTTTAPMRSEWDRRWQQTEEGYATIMGAFLRYQSELSFNKQGKTLVKSDG